MYFQSPHHSCPFHNVLLAEKASSPILPGTHRAFTRSHPLVDLVHLLTLTACMVSCLLCSIGQYEHCKSCRKVHSFWLFLTCLRESWNIRKRNRIRIVTKLIKWKEKKTILENRGKCQAVLLIYRYKALPGPRRGNERILWAGLAGSEWEQFLQGIYFCPSCNWYVFVKNPSHNSSCKSL